MSADDYPSKERSILASNKSWGRRTARMLALIYLGTLVALMFFENSLIYPAPPLNNRMWDQIIDHVAAQQFQLGELDGRPIVGWLYEPQKNADAETPQRFGLYFHGNGEDLAYSADFARRLSDDLNMIVLAVEYPGYGRSTGKACESKITSAAALARNWFCDRFQIGHQQIVLVGRSLGGGVAMSLAANNGSRAIILLSTFSSLPDVAAHRFWLLPVQVVMRSRFPSEERMKTCTQPLLQFHGDQDEIVPYKFGRQLFDASPAVHKRIVTLSGSGHNYTCGDLVWSEIKQFLDSLESTAVQR